MRLTQSLRSAIVSCSLLAACGASDGAAPNGSVSGGGPTSEGPGASGGGPGATAPATPDTGDVPGRARWWASEPSVTYKMFHLRAGIEWEHPGGDWTDATGTAQGTTPFASAEIADATGEAAVSWDVTTLVKQWLAEEARPTAVVLAQRGGNVRFHSREVAGKEPRLILTLADGTTVERLPSDDMSLDSSTTKVLGEAETLGKRAIVQWKREALFADVTDVTSATLSMISSVQKGKTNADVYQMKLPIPDVLPPLEQGLAAAYPADTGIDQNPMVVFAEDFHGTVADVESRWDGSSFNELVPCDLPGVPQCARVTIKGKADGGNGLGGTGGRKAFDSELEEAFMRYYVKFESWDAIDGGKFPGLANFDSGDGAKFFAGGNGGSPVHGYDGWTLRGAFMLPPPSSGDPASGYQALRTYAYTAAMTGAYGDMWSWSQHRTDLHVLKYGTWHSVEQHVKVNTPGQRDGLFEVWMDGRKVLRKTDVYLRAVPSATPRTYPNGKPVPDGQSYWVPGSMGITKLWANLYHGGTTPTEKTLVAYWANFVVARSYIGPMKSP